MLRYAEYPFLGLVFGVIELPDGQVVTTTMALAAAIGSEPRTLRANYENNRQMFSPLRGNSNGSKEILQLLREHKERFMVRRLKDDLLLWTEEDMYMHCHFSRSERAAQFMQHNVRFLREWRMANIGLSTIDQERFVKLETENAELRSQLLAIGERVDAIVAASPYLEKTASLAGGILAAQRGTKAARTLN
jgi:hypothetical protein